MDVRYLAFFSYKKGSGEALFWGGSLYSRALCHTDTQIQELAG